jgi:cyclophilin family peptidyl-prolyl cis-trans isomerase
MRTVTFAILVCTAFLLTACYAPVPSETSGADASGTPSTDGGATATDTTDSPMANPHVILHTTLGAIELELYTDKAPLTAGNFLKLAEEGFYTGTAFHRVIPDFMIQGGDPLSKNYSNPAIGTGGPPYRIKDEFAPGLKHDKPGILSMANAGPNTGGSQFFITTVPTPWLDGKHAIFGRVTSGMVVVEKIEAAPRGRNDKPLTPIVIERVEIKK